MVAIIAQCRTDISLVQPQAADCSVCTVSRASLRGFLTRQTLAQAQADVFNGMLTLSSDT